MTTRGFFSNSEATVDANETIGDVFCGGLIFTRIPPFPRAATSLLSGANNCMDGAPRFPSEVNSGRRSEKRELGPSASWVTLKVRVSLGLPDCDRLEDVKVPKGLSLFFCDFFFFRAIAANVGKNGAPDALADVCVDFEEASGIKNNGRGGGVRCVESSSR